MSQGPRAAANLTVSSGGPRELQVSVLRDGFHRDRDVLNHAADAVRQLQLYGPGLEQKGLNLKDERRDGVVHPSLLTVPPEIISKIFIYCLPQADGRGWLSPVTAPLLVTHISRKLREIAFATCQLWSSLRIDSRNPNVSADAHSFLHSWLGRAKGQPLSLTYFSDFDSARFSPFAPVIYPLIITYSHHLRSLKLVLDATDTLQFKSIRTVSFPILRHLEIQGEFTPHVGSEWRISNVDMYPSLTTVHTTYISIPEFYRVLASSLSITSTPLDYRMIISLIKSRHNAGIGLASFERIDCYLDEGAPEEQILKVANQYQELTTLGFKRSFYSGGIMAAVHESVVKLPTAPCTSAALDIQFWGFVEYAEICVTVFPLPKPVMPFLFIECFSSTGKPVQNWLYLEQYN
ncbi:hypothetical protein C8J57DRAFT_1680882 [Mycena rebaudengoi]|nr:hypothetical protein C8J57DRAFT_1680882 [Mycena rebaudengoi]